MPSRNCHYRYLRLSSRLAPPPPPTTTKHPVDEGGSPKEGSSPKGPYPSLCPIPCCCFPCLCPCKQHTLTWTPPPPPSPPPPRRRHDDEGDSPEGDYPGFNRPYDHIHEHSGNCRGSRDVTSAQVTGNNCFKGAYPPPPGNGDPAPADATCPTPQFCGSSVSYPINDCTCAAGEWYRFGVSTRGVCWGTARVCTEMACVCLGGCSKPCPHTCPHTPALLHELEKAAHSTHHYAIV